MIEQPFPKCVRFIIFARLKIIMFFIILVKFIYSEKATKFCEISTVDLSYVVPVKSTVEISQNFVAFSEYMTFIIFDFSTIRALNQSRGWGKLGRSVAIFWLK